MGGIVIPSITEKPGRSLGRVFDCSLRDATAIQATIREFESWLTTVKKSGLPGFKAWIYQQMKCTICLVDSENELVQRHGLVLPQVLWPLLLYEVTLSRVETMEKKVSGYLCRWLGLPRSVSSAALYGKSAPAPVEQPRQGVQGLSHQRCTTLSGLQGLESCISSHIHSPSWQPGCSPWLRTGSFNSIWGGSSSSLST